jgi:hypothetical protein
VILFDDITRTRRGFAFQSEDSFEFLNTSAQPFALNIRTLLQDWFERYPIAHQASLRGLFREDFHAAFFELLLHELLLRLGHKVAVHPTLPGVTTQPDFLATEAGSGNTFVEARIVNDKSASESATDREISAFCDEVNRLRMKGFTIWLRRVDIPSGKHPSGKRFRNFVEDLVNQLDPVATRIEAEATGFRHLEFVCYEDGGSIIEFALIPQPLAAQEEAVSPIGIYPGKSRWGTCAPAISKALKRKGGKYGNLNQAFVVAVNSMSEWNAGRDDFREALFGHYESKKTGGYWGKAESPAHRRVSAVLAGSLNPYNLHVAELVLWKNPWASHPYCAPLDRMPRAEFRNGQVDYIEGLELGEVLGIPSDWPGEREMD